MTWDKPTDEKCPKCGKSLFKKKGGILACLDENCGFEKKRSAKRKAQRLKRKTDESSGNRCGSRRM